MQNIVDQPQDEFTASLIDALENGIADEKIPVIDIPPVALCATYTFADREDESKVRPRLIEAFGALVRCVPYAVEVQGVRKIHLKFVTREKYDAAKQIGKERKLLLRACTYSSCTDCKPTDFVAISSTLTYTDISKVQGFTGAFEKYLETKSIYVDALFVSKSQKVIIHLYDLASALKLANTEVVFCGKKLTFVFTGGMLKPCCVCQAIDHVKRMCDQRQRILRLKFVAPVSQEFVEALARVAGNATVRPFGDASTNLSVYDIIFASADALRQHGQILVAASRQGGIRTLEKVFRGDEFPETALCTYCAGPEHRGPCPRAAIDRARRQPVFPTAAAPLPIVAAAANPQPAAGALVAVAQAIPAGAVQAQPAAELNPPPNAQAVVVLNPPPNAPVVLSPEAKRDRDFPPLVPSPQSQPVQPAPSPLPQQRRGRYAEEMAAGRRGPAPASPPITRSNGAPPPKGARKK